VYVNTVYEPDVVLAKVPVPLPPEAEDVVTLALAADAGEVPAEFVAVTVNVYAVLAVNPLTTIGEDPPVAVIDPGLLVTVYELTTPDGGVKETLIVVESDAVPVTDVGAEGIVIAIPPKKATITTPFPPVVPGNVLLPPPPPPRPFVPETAAIVVVDDE